MGQASVTAVEQQTSDSPLDGTSDADSHDDLLEELELRNRSYNCLKRARLHTVGALARRTPDELKAVPNFGAKSLEEVRVALIAYLARSDGEAAPDPAELDEKVSLANLPPPADLPRAREVAPELLPTWDRIRAAANELHSRERRTPVEEVLLAIASKPSETYELTIVLLRREHTLAEIGSWLGVTRERVRQIENAGRKRIAARGRHLASEHLDAQAAALEDAILSDEEALSPARGWGTPLAAVDGLSRVLLESLDAQSPRTWGDDRLNGWWTRTEFKLARLLAAAAARAPFRADDVDELLAVPGVSTTVPIRDLMVAPGSPLTLHRSVDAYVRRRAHHRDAAYLLLLESGQPAGTGALADRLGVKAHALREALRRDERFRLLRPGSRWALTEWPEYLEQHRYATALEAGIGVLSDLGPLPYSDYARHLSDRYPVSEAQIRNTLLSVEFGRWPDGRIDLSARGAPVQPEQRPPRPPHVDESADGAVISFSQAITSEAVRGSGIVIHPYISHALGLRNAPAQRAFATRDGSRLVIRRHIGSAAVSTLRKWILQLGAGPEDVLRVTLDTRDDTATVRLETSSDQRRQIKSVFEAR